MSEPKNAIEQATLDLWRKGVMTADEIGLELGKSKNAIVGMVNRMRQRGVDVSRDEVVMAKRKLFHPVPKPIPVQLDDDPKGYEKGHLPVRHLNSRTCRWPYGDTRAESGVTYCGDVTMEVGRSYCREHHTKAYYSPSRRS